MGRRDVCYPSIYLYHRRGDGRLFQSVSSQRWQYPVHSNLQAFIATPRTVGLIPNHLLRQALPNCLWYHVGLLTVPIVAHAAFTTCLIIPLCNISVTHLSSFFTIHSYVAAVH